MELFSRDLQNTQNPEAHNEVLSSNSSPSLGPSTTDHLSSFHLTAPSPSFFQNATNFEVKDAQFNVNANVTINNNATTNDPVSTILWPHVVAGAIFNSAERYAAGKCHPGTRKKIIERIVAWIEDPDPTQHILWIYGPAGAGKSAIAQTICEFLKESYPDTDGGSFFFSNDHSDRRNALKLFATLAYQLAVQFPSVRTQLNDVLSRDPSLPTKSMEIQLFSLIILPLLRCNPHLSHCPVLIIDGLDECDNGKGTTQRDIVALISKSVVGHRVPLRFMILSRPEYWIRDAFDTSPLPDITLSLSLRDDRDADKDIRVYLTEEFERIRVENKRFMRSVVPPWPPTDIIERFVEEASGQYIYAATILKFVGNFSKFSNPQTQLDILTSPGPHRALAFSELDRLYATILSAYPQWETMKRVLAALLLGANTTIITGILGVDSDELVLVFDALSSLIDIKRRGLLSEDHLFLESIFDAEFLHDGANTISFCHLSFREFLQDETRSGAFYIQLDSVEVTQEIVNGFFGMVLQNLDQTYEVEPYIYCNIDYATYHSILSRVTAESIRHSTIIFLLPHITQFAARLELFDPIKFTHMDSIFYFLRDMRYLRSALQSAFRNELPEQRSKKGKPEMLTQFQSTCQNLEQAIKLACDGGQSALASCTDFQATPSFVYLTEYWFYGYALPLDGLRSIAGITDVVSTLKQHHYIFAMWYNTQRESWSPIGAPLFWQNTLPIWRTQGAWRDLRILFAPNSLKSIFNDPRTRLESDEYMTRHLALKTFFDSRKISDIANEEYFDDTSNLDILSAITDAEAWITLLDNNYYLPPTSFLVSILCWINRQLTNPLTVTLLRKYNKALQERMITVMNCIFERGFLKQFMESDREELCAYASELGTNNDSRSTIFRVWPLPGGFHEEEMDPDSAYEYWDPEDWQTFHNELFGKTGESPIKAPINPIIHPSRWHPHLITTLLTVLVRFLYGQIHPDFSTKGYDYEQSFPYITECVLYAHPTLENLGALRMLVYLYPQAASAWNPPEGLWPLLVDFLHKYDRSILSSEELRLFVVWLNSTKHEDIKTYIDD